MLKSTSVIVSRNVLIKIKSIDSNTHLIWFFGPIGVTKLELAKVPFLLMHYRLLILVFSLRALLNKKTSAYCESVGHLIKATHINTSKSYVNYMRVKGVGYKLEQKNPKQLIIVLGYSHKILMDIPSYIKICILKKRIIIWSYSLEKLQKFCCYLTNLRKRDPYNGKGILQPHLQRKLKVGKISRI